MGLKHATITTRTLLEEALGLDAGALDELRDTTAAERGRKGAAARLGDRIAIGQKPTLRNRVLLGLRLRVKRTQGTLAFAL